MLARFARLKMSVQLGMIAGLAVLGVSALSVSTLVSQTRLSERVTESQDKGTLAASGGRVTTRLLELRAMDVAFASAPSAELLAARAKLANELTDAVEALRLATRSRGAGDYGAQADRLPRLLASYLTLFKAYADNREALGFTPDQGLEGALRKAVHAIEKQLADLDAAPMKIAMLQMRRAEKDFMLRGDPKYIEAVEKWAAEFRAAQSAALISPDVTSALSRQLDAYVNAFKAWATGSVALAEQAKNLTAAFEEVKPAVSEISDRAFADQDADAAIIHQLLGATTVNSGVTSLAIGVLIGFGALGASLVMVRSIRGLTRSANAIADGDRVGAVPCMGWRNEFGALAGALQVLRDGLAREEADRAVRERSSVDEAERLSRRAGAATRFVAEIEDLVARFGTLARETADAARALSTTAEDTSRQATTVAKAADTASSTVDTIAAAAEELTASVRSISSDVGRSAAVADDAWTEAASSDKRLQGLLSAASKIGEVVTLIKGIADQTNLLALNATIEAARAGEAGRGFAVVASEVKQLASQTATATEEIARVVKDVQAETDTAVRSAAQIMAKANASKEITATIAVSVEEQEAATSGIAESCRQAASSAGLVRDTITGVSRAAEMTGSASVQLMALSQTLSGEVGGLKQKVDAFMRELDAA